MIDEIEQQNFLKDILHFESGPVLDMDKIIVAGHSFGGSTAIKTAWEDKRVKCVLTMDPWLLPIQKTFTSQSYNGFKNNNIKFQIINSEGFIALNHQKHLNDLE